MHFRNKLMDLISPTTSPAIRKSDFVKFLSIENEFLNEKFHATFRKKFHNRLIVEDQNGNNDAYVENEQIKKLKISTTFTNNYGILFLISKEYPLHPLCVYLQYVIDDREQDDTSNMVAEILSFEIWISSDRLQNCYQQFNTFMYEQYFAFLLRRMLAQCNNIKSIKNISNVSDEEYKALLSTYPTNSYWNPQLPLFRHQLQSLAWMNDLENDVIAKRSSISINPFDTNILNTGYYYNRQRDVITDIAPMETVNIPYQGGILANTTGSGKTLIALALILLTQTDKTYETLHTMLDRKLLFQSRATLIITPTNLSQQWISEIHKFVLPVMVKKLKIITILDTRDWKRHSLQDLLQADIVFTTVNFLTCKRYQNDVCNHTQRLLEYPIMEFNNSVFQMAWRVARNRTPPGFATFDYCIPFECIKWKRIIHDEIHSIFSSNNDLPDLKACFYWGLSGTPMIENKQIFQRYVQFFSVVPRYWLPQFVEKIIERCFHRFDKIDLGPVEKHLYLIDLTNREKQLLQCCQPDLSVEKVVQLCSYFNLVDINTMSDKIQMLTIEEIIKKVKRDRQRKLRDLELKLKHHDTAITTVRHRINEAQHELKTLFKDEKVNDDDEKEINVNDEKEMNADEKEMNDDEEVDEDDVEEEENENDDEIQDRMRFESNMIRSRTRRLERMLARREQLAREHKTLEKGIGFFEGKLSSLPADEFETCPICFTQPANVITVCGHIFCRACLIRCFQRKYQCPICKSQMTPSDAHEIRRPTLSSSSSLTNQDDEKRQDRIAMYGSKITRLLDLINDITRRNEKAVIYVQWNSLLNLIKEILKKLDYRVDVVVGNAACQNAAVRKFKNNEVDVLMLSLENASSGLDLVEGNHLIFIHALVEQDHVVKALEEQAIARIHRTGQNKQVHVYWFVTRGTVEEQIYLQTRR